jgi:hypothetical protein
VLVVVLVLVAVVCLCPFPFPSLPKDELKAQAKYRRNEEKKGRKSPEERVPKKESREGESVLGGWLVFVAFGWLERCEVR